MPTPLKDEFSAIPYAERQLVVVLPDKVVAAAKAAEAAAARSNSPIDWKALAEAALPAMGLNPLGALVDVTAQAVKAWSRARQGGLSVLEISRADARTLRFPPGHPRDTVLYVGHPAIPDIYYTFSSFHRLTFEHKFAEAVDLLMELGAKEIRVEHVRGWSRKFASNLSVALPLKEEGSAHVSGGTKGTTSLLYEASLKGSTHPKLPENLVWYPHEPTWQSIAKGRITHGLTQFSLSVNYDDDFGVNAGVKLSAHRAGLELGGNFEDHEATTWTLHGKFADS